MASTLSRSKINLLDKITEYGAKAKSIISGMHKAKAQETLEISRKNWIINGDHQVNQRGLLPLSSGTESQYKLTDRWRIRQGTITASAILGSYGTANTIKVTATSTGTGAYYIGADQLIENSDYFKGKTITQSAWVRSNHSSAALIGYDGVNTIYSFHSGSGNWEYLTLTFTVADNATILEPHVMIYTGGTITITSGDYIEFTKCKLEIGDTATPFEVEPYAEVLRKCQRYYQRSNDASTPISNGSTTTTFYSEYGLEFIWVPHRSQNPQDNYLSSPLVKFAVEMRTSPSVVMYGNSAGNIFRPDSDIWVQNYGSLATTKGFSPDNEWAVGIVPIFCHWTAEAEL